MKKIYSILMLAMMAVAALSFTACGNDDVDDANDGGNIVGTWKYDDISLNSLLDNLYEDVYGDDYEDNSYTDAYIQFRENGTYVDIEVYDDGDVDVERGTYKVEDGFLIMREGGEDFTYTYKVSGKKLSVTFGGAITMTLTKVNDSVIDKYLNR